MKQRFYDRAAAVLSIALLAGLAAFSYYLAELSNQFRKAESAGPVRHEPDYFVEDFAVTRLSRAGDPAFRMSATRLVHYADDDTSEFTQPVLVSLDPAKPLVTLRAKRGKSGSAGDQTHLYDDVVLVRAGFEGKPPLRVQTDYLLLLSSEEIARTDRPVTITQGSSSLTGVGMEFDNSARVLNLNSNVRGIWVRPANR